MATSTAAQADQIDKLSERTSINREELQRWMHACDQSGVSSDKLSTAVKKTSNVLEDARGGSKSANEALEKLGFTLGDFDGKSTEETFDMITSALADMEEGTERNALGVDLLGGAYTEMLPLLNAGSEGIRGLKQEADDLGIVMSEDAVKAGVTLGDTISNIKAAFNGFKNELGSAMIPVIQQFANLIMSKLPDIQKLFQRLIPVVMSLIDGILPPLFELIDTLFPILFDFLDSLLPVLESIISNILPVIVDLLRQMLPFLVQTVQRILPLVLELIEELLPFAMEIIEAILPVLMQLLEAIVPVLIEIIEAILPVVIELIQMLLPVILEIIQQVLPVIVDLIIQLMPLLLQIIEAVLPVVIQLIEQLLPVAIQIIEAVLPIVIDLLNTLMPIITELIKSVLPVVSALLSALMPILQPILDLLLTLLSPLLDLLNLILPPLIKLFETIMNAILPVLQGALSTVADVLSTVFGGAFESVGKIVENIKGVFQGIIDFVKKVFTGDWEGAWDEVGKIFANIWEGMKEAFKIPINWIIDGINVFVRGLNKIQIPDWVPGVGGKGLNIKELSRLRIGMDYVPYDDYPALLHKGEQVLTASEAKDRRQEEIEKNTVGGRDTGKNVNITLNLNIDKFENNSGQDIENLADDLLERLEEKIRQKEGAFA